MPKIYFEETGFNGLRIVHPFIATDDRGFFLKAYEKALFDNEGIETNIAETFESYSKQGVVRGLHFQLGKNAQAKLVRVLCGEVFDVCVDIRKGSSTFGKWFGHYLSGENHEGLYIERGFAHGFLVTGKEALMSYTVSGEYSMGQESGIKYDDIDLNIPWPLNGIKQIVQSERDKALQCFKDYCDSVDIIN